MPKLSIIIPIHQMKNGAEFLWRSINALTKQSFQDYELIITQEGSMPINTNAGIKRAKGELIKILYLDDYLAHENALQDIVDAMKDKEWLITGCDTNLSPYWTPDIIKGNNHLGSPSCLTFRNHFEDNLLFDENLSWLLDVVYYNELYKQYGEPIILTGEHIIMGIGNHQMTNILTDEQKLKEHIYVDEKNTIN